VTGRVIRVAAAQLPGCGTDPAANLAAVQSALRSAAAEGAELVVLPELATMPYFCAEPPAPWREWAAPVPGPLTEGIGRLTAELGLTAVFPLFERAAGAFHNSSVVISRGEVVPAVDRGGTAHPVTRKLHLPVGDEPAPGFNEPAHFTAGNWLGTHHLPLLSLGVLICYDRRFPECWRELRSLGADLVAVPVAGSGGDSPAFFRGELSTHARENGLFVVAANKVGTERVGGHAVDNFGESCVIGPDGELLAHRSRADGPGLAVAEVDVGLLAETRKRLPYFEHRRTDLYPDVPFGPPASQRPAMEAR
jgi:N-carbamoylputrescine amidase